MCIKYDPPPPFNEPLIFSANSAKEMLTEESLELLGIHTWLRLLGSLVLGSLLFH